MPERDTHDRTRAGMGFCRGHAAARGWIKPVLVASLTHWCPIIPLGCGALNLVHERGLLCHECDVIEGGVDAMPGWIVRE